MFIVNPIKFGTDGWRGVIAADFTFERVARLAAIAAQVLAANYAEVTGGSRLVIVGYDRRFLAEDFARVAAEAIQCAGFDVWLSSSYAPTPAFSWAAQQAQALGAIVLTASHNPSQYLGLKVKGYFGGSVAPEITQQMEALLDQPLELAQEPGQLRFFEPWESYCQGLKTKVNLAAIQAALRTGELKVYADAMHGAAATGLGRLLDFPIVELHSDRDPFFGGHPPEPLPQYLSEILAALKAESSQPSTPLRVGLVFDGDCDRIAAVDGAGNFLSSQILIPILMAHLVGRQEVGKEVVKTVGGSDLIPKVAQFYGLSVFETPIGYKYIADRMLDASVLIGGEESGGVGYGNHIPERDALLSALYVLEAIVTSKTDLSERYSQLQEQVGFISAYDRIDLPLPSMAVRNQLLERLLHQAPKQIAGLGVTDCLTVDGYKFRLEDGRWLLIRFSGTEPVLRLYCEAPTLEQVHQTLNWARDWAKEV